jgi:UDPglucose 6-dehydrogenase
LSTISVIGAGYVGLVTGACLAELGHNVISVEVDHVRLAALKNGDLPIYEPGLDELFARHRRSGRLRFTGDYAVAIPQSDFAFVAVNTPSQADGRADTSFVKAAVRTILEYARPGLTIVTKSTVPVGTGDAIQSLVERSEVPAVNVASNPEFLREGSAISDFLSPDRIVVGADEQATRERVASLFAAIRAPILHCSRRTAELAKYASNALLATRISFMNEIEGICARAGADVGELSRIVGADRRIGPAFLSAGLGWGGSCFPKDVRALIATAEDHGKSGSILHAVLDVNVRQREAAFERLREAVDGRDGATVGVLGLAFKPGTDDIREAPALDVIGRLVEEGVHVRAHDPIAMPNAQRNLPNIRYCADAYEVAENCDALLLATEWPEYLELDWRAMRVCMRGDAIVDGRHVLDVGLLSSLGFTCLSIGGGLHPAAAKSAQRS